MSPHIDRIRQNIEPIRHEIINHPVYSVIHDLDDLKLFMQYHVYAVWDFMSLLKALQNNLTCTSVPWFPVGNSETRFLINEIVVGEESDVDLNGERKSHFELYLDAMQQCGADTGFILRFIDELKTSGDFGKAYEASATPGEARSFVNFTFDTIRSNKAHLQAAVFTFGREDLIPNMFLSLVRDMHKTFPDHVSVFKYYLERHIEVDGDHHSHLALQMTENLCNIDEAYWHEAEAAITRSLKKRVELWNGVYKAIMAKRPVEA
ncbi:MAG: DUF3050 domain-containing protein [Bacteroidetes bacterium]|nr:DUF3050 domain-containing protein [Bacteroidota bacterium]